MRRNVKLISTLTALGILIFSAGCGVLENNTDTDTYTDGEEGTAYDTTPFSMNISGYTVVYPRNAAAEFKEYLEGFCNMIYEYTGAELSFCDDSSRESEKEILLGRTAREESKRALEALKGSEIRDGAYIIREDNGKIVINGNNEKVVLRAMKRFLINYAEQSSENKAVIFQKGEIEIDILDPDSILFADFTEFFTETLSEVSGISTSSDERATVYSYETMIELAHNGENNGTLLASHATLYGSSGYKIYRSEDSGESWSLIAVADDDYTENKINSSLQPCLFELPRDMGRFKEGTLFLAGCTQGKDGEQSTTHLALYYSTDLGKSWTAYLNLAHGLSDADDQGVWEPYLYYDDATERVYCFYSDETYPKSSPSTQKLVCKYTEDMENWSETVDIINGDDTSLRPGMLSVAKMGNGEYFMAYEIYNIDGCPVYYRKTDSLEDIDSKDYGTLLQSIDGKTVGSAPWCAWSPVGGECGTLVVAAHHMVNGSAIEGKVDMFVSFDYGETFIAIKNPIFIYANGLSKVGYSPHVSFSEDGSALYYLNNTVEYGYELKVMFAKIKIW